MRFENRAEAGRELGRALLGYAGRDLLVVGLPRGGVPVAFEVADMLAAPLEVWVMRKLGCGERPALAVEGKTVVLVDDGAATGATTRAAIKGLRKRGAAELVLAVPVASTEAISALRPLVDDVVCLSRPRDLGAIGAWYQDFEEVSDLEVTSLLELARTRRQADEARARGHRQGAGTEHRPR
jgi:putative phosphoribosyl transferase